MRHLQGCAQGSRPCFWAAYPCMVQQPLQHGAVAMSAPAHDSVATSICVIAEEPAVATSTTCSTCHASSACDLAAVAAADAARIALEFTGTECVGCLAPLTVPHRTDAHCPGRAMTGCIGRTNCTGCMSPCSDLCAANSVLLRPPLELLLQRWQQCRPPAATTRCGVCSCAALLDCAHCWRLSFQPCSPLLCQLWQLCWCCVGCNVVL